MADLDVRIAGPVTLDALDPILDVIGRLRPAIGTGVFGAADQLLGITGQLVAIDLDLALGADEDRPQAGAAVAVRCSFNSVPLAKVIVTLARGPLSRAMPW